MYEQKVLPRTILAFITLSEVCEDVFMHDESALFYAMKCLKQCFEMFMSFHNEYMCLNSSYANCKKNSSSIYTAATVIVLLEY